MLAALHFISQAPQSGQPVVITSYVELLTVLSLLTVIGAACTWYRHSRCHSASCRNRLGFRRHGKYPHGPLRLCRKHHPSIPGDGRITQQHIDAVTKGSH